MGYLWVGSKVDGFRALKWMNILDVEKISDLLIG
jgi:hypothetical protein